MFHSFHQLALGDQFVFLKGSDEFAHVVLDNLPTCAELAADHVHDVCLCRSTLKKFQNPRPNRIQVEHLSLMDIEHDRAILAVCASDSIRDSVQGLAPLLRFNFSNRVWHTLPLAAVETPLICEFVRERIRGFRTTLPLQRHASVASGFTEIEYVRVSDLVDENTCSDRAFGHHKVRRIVVQASDHKFGATDGHSPSPVSSEVRICRPRG